MKKLKIIFSVILVMVILWGIQWMFHGFPVKPSNINNAKPTGDIESNLNTFLTDTALPRIIESCIPLYNTDFRRLNPQLKNSPDLITADYFNKNQLITTNPHTRKKEANLSTVNIINEFFTVLDSPMSDPKMLQECFGNYGYTLQDMRRIKKNFSNFANSN
ncbi:hypothetical protein E0H83_12180 [Acinetobacter terrestris]|uniref:hypothetical protein n=1 Tax=Acinetobacter terrestris TaxID=2529843 RepID=UPI00103AD6A9|nr:hypothetical protein [Acinetobacter terrestris]TCB42273.1 hypothetical protein E0H83_12180 [Acinetobacter terrestris]